MLQKIIAIKILALSELAHKLKLEALSIQVHQLKDP